MMENALVSVIVPVYNVAPFLSKCLDSIIGQTYSKLEIILVDDGSTDGSSQICDSYAEQDKRIVVNHGENRGSAYARKLGLALSTGEWVMMADSDDWLEPNAVQLLLQTAIERNADLIKAGYFINYSNRIKYYDYPILNTKEDYIESLLARRMSLSLCSGLYRKSLFDSLSPVFIEDLNFGEDYLAISRLMYFSRNYCFIKPHLYHYRILNSGYVGSRRWENVEQLIECEKLINAFFAGRDNGRYVPSLRRGRANIKFFAYEYILSNFKENSIYLDVLRPLYKGDVDYSELSLYNYLIIKILDYKCLTFLALLLYKIRFMLYQLIKFVIGMSRLG